jgi:hypothetical protein
VVLQSCGTLNMHKALWGTIMRHAKHEALCGTTTMQQAKHEVMRGTIMRHAKHEALCGTTTMR